MTLKELFYNTFGILLVILSFLVVVSLFGAIYAYSNSKNAKLMIEKVRLSEELQIHVLSTNRELLLFHLTKNNEHQKNYHFQKTKVSSTIELLKPLISFDKEKQSLDDVKKYFQFYLESTTELFEMNIEPMIVFQRSNPLLRKVLQSANQLISLNLNHANQMANQNINTVESLFFITLMVVIVASLFTPFAWNKMRKNLYVPILKLRTYIASYHKDLQPINFEIPSTIEIKELADTFIELSYRLQEQNKAQYRFLAGVSHDLKNPLTAIQNSIGILRSQNYSAEDQNQLLDIVARQTKKLSQMVGDFLDANRIESGHLEIKKRNTNLYQLIEDAVILHRQVSDLHSISISGETEGLFCNCDPTRISQVLNNLLNNAIKYSPNGGVINVDISKHNRFISISVKDNGIGISKADQEKIFEPFRRTSLTKATIPGVGLGLSISKHIVEAHAGVIEVQSQDEKGTTFTIKLPFKSCQNQRKMS